MTISDAIIFLVGLWLGLVLMAGLWFVLKMRQKQWDDTTFPDTEQKPTADVTDPWVIQRTLMGISGQKIPEQPMLTREVLLYYARIMEENAEVGEVLLRILGALQLPLYEDRQTFGQLRQTIAATGRSMGFASRRMRQLLALPSFATWEGVALDLKQAEALLREISDLQAVNSGFPLAAGLPAEEGYIEVGASNLTKLDPTTGRIETDQTGRWVRSKGYEAPELARVLVEYFPWIYQSYDQQEVLVGTR